VPAQLGHNKRRVSLHRMHRVMSGGSMWNGDVSPSRVCEAIAKARTLGFTVLARVGIADRRVAGVAMAHMLFCFIDDGS
jgi:hypothetical protein